MTVGERYPAEVEFSIYCRGRFLLILHPGCLSSFLRISSLMSSKSHLPSRAKDRLLFDHILYFRYKHILQVFPIFP